MARLTGLANIKMAAMAKMPMTSPVQKQKEEAGVYDDLIRVSVGIEDLGDLIEDFRQAIEMMEKQ